MGWVAAGTAAAGKAALAMLLFEDIALVPIVFLLGAMGRGGDAQSGGDLVQTLVLPVVEADGRKIGDGKPGPVARAIRKAYVARLCAA